MSEVFAFIAAEKANYPVALMCRALEVNRTSFHDWERRPPSDRALQDAWLLEQIKEIHETHRRVYGAPRIHAELRLGRGGYRACLLSRADHEEDEREEEPGRQKYTERRVQIVPGMGGIQGMPRRASRKAVRTSAWCLAAVEM